MNRRNFLKDLSSIPLIGIPVKLLAKEQTAIPIIPLPEYITMKNGSTITFTEPSDETFVGSPHSDEYFMYADPYEATDFKEQLLKASKSKNPFHEGVVRGVRAKWRRV